MENIKTQVVAILNKYIFDKKVWNIAPENPKIIADLKINSARVVDIVLDVEELFGIEIDNKTLEKIITLNDIISVIKSKTGG
ncbi:MAG: acyl carrier protein [Bacteroidia bacterium]|nr:acyl carrier protein [Bacteroidia bacterium]